MKNEIESAVLLLSCKDKRGIVAEISHFVSTYDGNIITLEQHSDDETNIFFMRIEWDLTNFSVPKEKIYSAFEPIAIKFKMDWKLEFSTKKIRMAIFVSRFDHCLYDILLRNKAGEMDAEIALIISNHQDAGPIAEYFGIPFRFFEINADNKEAVEAAELKLLKDEKIDLIVLARYMQILSSDFVREFRNRIINIHHSFLPAFVGAKPYHQAFSRGVKIIGATSHYVTEELDQGPIIEQDVARITHKDNIESLVLKGRNLEKLVLSRAVKLHIEHKVLVFANKTVVFS
jgi:formyltetrahydrofolate deformylase